MKLLFVVLVIALAGCATTATAPVVERTREPPPPRAGAPSPLPPVAQPALPEAPPGSYVVRRGDTLYSIALDNGLDYRELAAWNSLSDPNVIREGQVLSLKPPPSEAQVRPITGLGGVQVRPLGEAETAPRSVPARPPGGLEPAPQPLPAEPMLVTEPKGLKLPYSEQSLALLGKPPAAVVPGPPPSPPQPEVKPEARPKAEAVEGGLDWSWPANGKIVATFSDPVSKGVDIAGRKGEPVTASASGRVVYIGEGLRGYGKLVIIKHNDTFLSAYAHNDAILVKEGQSVVRGQKIAEIGSTGTDQTKLHFEIRQLGKPVDPLKFLPERPL